MMAKTINTYQGSVRGAPGALITVSSGTYYVTVPGLGNWQAYFLPDDDPEVSDDPEVEILPTIRVIQVLALTVSVTAYLTDGVMTSGEVSLDADGGAYGPWTLVPAEAGTAALCGGAVALEQTGAYDREALVPEGHRSFAAAIFEKVKERLKADKPPLVALWLSAEWTAHATLADTYTQTVTVPGGTANSIVSLQPSDDQLDALREAGVTGLRVNNNFGRFTATAFGAAPGTELTVQATVTELTRRVSA